MYVYGLTMICAFVVTRKRLIVQFRFSRFGGNSSVQFKISQWWNNRSMLLLRKVIAQGFPGDFQNNWIEPPYKEGNMNQLTNYHTFMVGSCMTNLLGTIAEDWLNEWAEKHRNWMVNAYNKKWKQNFVQR